METYLNELGIINPKAVYENLSPADLVEKALEHGEGKLSDTGAFVVYTGKFTGRSPNDRFVVDEPSCHDKVAWGKINVPVTEQVFDNIYNRITAYLQNRDLFVFDGFAGADTKYRKSFRIINTLASQNLFIHNLLRRPTADELKDYKADYTVIAAPDFKCIPELDGVNSEAAIIINFKKKITIVAGSGYSGEIKKSIFSVMNYYLPQEGVLSMHCSANIGKDGKSALFFGLSGTGKTTLSADPNRKLIGDDEHGWSDDGVFNIEGGCYAKMINLSKEHEPEIYNAVKFGTLVENVVMDEKTRELDFDDGKYTQNTRAGYPVNYIPSCELEGVGGHPTTVIFLTADASGVLPPIAKLTKEQAMYYYVSGYTSKLAGTERGIVDPLPTFSTCFGAPFLPLNSSVYAEMLGKKIEKHNAGVYLVNTGWSGGPYGVGKRMKLPFTRAMITAALNGDFDKVEFKKHPIFGIAVPTSCPNVPSEILDPRNTWEDKAAYDKKAKEIAASFVNNFKKYTNMPKAIVEAGPNA